MHPGFSLEIIVLGNVTIFGTGDDIQLDCSQSAGLNFSSWLKNEEIIPEFSTTLKIENSTIEDSGMYTCIASTTSTSTEIYFNSSVSIKVIGQYIVILYRFKCQVSEGMKPM